MPFVIISMDRMISSKRNKGYFSLSFWINGSFFTGVDFLQNGALYFLIRFKLVASKPCWIRASKEKNEKMA